MTWSKAGVDLMVAQHGVPFMIATVAQHLWEKDPKLYRKWLRGLDKQKKPEPATILWPWVN